jgi:hypothetical protein
MLMSLLLKDHAMLLEDVLMPFATAHPRLAAQAAHAPTFKLLTMLLMV